VVDQLGSEMRPSTSASARPQRWSLAIAAAACTAAVILSHETATPAAVVALTLLGTLLSIELSRRESHAPGDPRPIAWTITGLYVLAVTWRPRFGSDIWSYAMVGRIFESHDLNPYRTAPAELLQDPMLHLLQPTWSTGTTPYGPLFVLQSGFVAGISGAHPLLYRVAFQASAALAVAAVLWLLWRETRSTAALALVGLSPAVAGSIVNGGHNDALIALGLLGTVLLLARGRALAAGWVLCATVLVKLTIGFAVLPLVLWTATRSGWRDVFRLLAPGVLVAGPIMLLIPGAFDSMTSSNSVIVTRLSVINVFQRVSWLGFTDHTPATFVTAGLAAAVAVSVAGAFIGRRQPDAGRGAAIGTAGWLVAAGYVLAWYTVLGLAVAALRPTDRLARWLAVQGGVITAAFLIPRESLGATPIGRIVMFWVPLALTIGFVWAVVPLVRDARRLSREARPSRASGPSGSVVSRTSPTPTA
jgi:alpha-1,6-mannosyltransferase